MFSLIKIKIIFLVLKAEKTLKLNNVWSKKRAENFHFELICKTYYCKRMILCNMRVGIRKCWKTISKHFLVDLDKISFQ